MFGTTLSLRPHLRDKVRIERLVSSLPFRRSVLLRELLSIGLDRLDKDGAEVLVRRAPRPSSSVPLA